MNDMKRANDLVRFDAEAVLASRTGLLSALRGQHLFISGGTGFLGAWLLELVAVLNDVHDFGMRVTVFSRNAREFARRWPHLASKGVTFQDGDIRYLGELPRDIRYIIHAAALTDRRLVASQPGAVAETNAVGTMRLLRASQLLEDLQKFVLLSSGLVYGTQPWNLPQVDENYAGPMRCDDVNAVYAESKRFAEILAHSAMSENKLPIVILRPFAFIGPYQSLQLPWAITDFIRDSFNGGPIRIMGDGATIRTLMYGSDYAFWVLLALANGAPRETYNVGSSEPVSLGSLAQMITQFFSPVPEIQTGLGQVGHDRTRLVPCVAKAETELGVRMTVPLFSALQRTITWNQFVQPL